MAVKILVADDNLLVRRALCRVLEALGPWSIIEAENGEEAVTRAREISPTLVILDLAMPGMDGMRAARAISLLHPGIPIVMHTLHWSQRVELEARKLGVRKVVAKTDGVALLSIVQEILAEEPGASCDPSGLPMNPRAAHPSEATFAEPGEMAREPLPAVARPQAD